MPAVLMKCPTTGKDVRVGMSVPDEKALKNLIAINNVTRCTACGKDHTWSGRDIFLEKEA